MIFTSTRDKSVSVGFAKAVMDAMPADGGLYVPAETEDLRRWILYTNEDTTFASIAGALTSAFIHDEFSPIICETIATKAFTFSPKFKRLDESHFLLELYHGPTGYHRDFGVAYLAACIETICAMRSSEAVMLDAARPGLGQCMARELRGKKRVKAVVVYPAGGVKGLREDDFSWNGGNICPVEVDGTEDEARALVDAVFSDHDFVVRNNLTLSNTTNIGRLLPQAFFYPYAFSRLKNSTSGDIYYALAPGNYSNVVAGLYSWQFALPLNGFCVPSTEALTTDSLGDSVMVDSLVPVASRPRARASDPSNLERLEDVFCANKRMMRNFIYPARLTDEMVDSAARELFMKWRVFADRHTARAYAAGKANEKLISEDGGAMVIIARDHPALSADYIRRAVGESPAMPDRLAEQSSPVKTGRKPVKTVDALKRRIREVR